VVIHASSVTEFDFGDLQIRDYTASLEGRSSVAEITAPPRSRHPRALSRRSDKFYWVLEGSPSFEIDGAETKLGIGDLAIIPMGTTFAYWTHDSKVRMLLVHTPQFEAEDEVLLER
jgi:mannose-6-phosphate isomerase-like protein (cupin superfamily)